MRLGWPSGSAHTVHNKDLVPYRMCAGITKTRPAAVTKVVMLLVCCARTFALNPSLDVTQFAHTAWTAREGLRGSVRSIVQTPDGVLWLGTEFGITRFDGVRFVPWTPAAQQLPSSNIRSLLTAQDGTLWIGTVEGLASWARGSLTVYPELAGQNILTLAQDREGTVWAGTFGTPNGNLCAVQCSHVECYGKDGIFGQWVATLFEDSSQQLWAHTGHGLWHWRPGEHKTYPVGLPGSFEASHTVAQNDEGAGVLAIANGKVVEVVGGSVSEYPLAGTGETFYALNLLRDHDGALWIGTEGAGLLRAYRGRASLF